MIREVERDIYAIDVPLKGNPLKALNSYFIRGKERDLLIDTGFRRDSCREALEEALKNLESERARRSVLCTHLHSDHSGMADLFAGDNQPIHMSEADTRLHCRFATGEARKISHERFLKEGFPFGTGVFNESGAHRDHASWRPANVSAAGRTGDQSR